MQAGETLGKVTKLKYIDDISDDELTIYVFEDNTKCDEAYIAEMNCMEAFNGRYVMTELTEPTNKWTFTTKEFNLEEARTVVGADGQTYELPNAGIGLNGEHVSLTFSEDGTPMSRPSATAGKRTDATPPRVYKVKNVEPKENYLLSLHPELINSKAKMNNMNNMNNDIMSHTVNINKQTQPPVNTQHEHVIKQNNVQIANPISTNVIETVKHASITINLDDIANCMEYDNITIIHNGNKQNINVQDFILRLTSEIPTAPNNIEEQIVNPYSDPEYKEDILITNMIDKSKKKVYTIGVDVELELPPKEVYMTIKNVYPDGMAQHFVTSISRRMNNDMLKEALATGLTAYYESSTNNDSCETQE